MYPFLKAWRCGRAQCWKPNARFRQFHHPEGIVVLSHKPWQALCAVQASGPGLFMLPRPCLCCRQLQKEATQGSPHRSRWREQKWREGWSRMFQGDLRSLAVLLVYNLPTVTSLDRQQVTFRNNSLPTKHSAPSPAAQKNTLKRELLLQPCGFVRIKYSYLVRNMQVSFHAFPAGRENARGPFMVHRGVSAQGLEPFPSSCLALSVWGCSSPFPPHPLQLSSEGPAALLPTHQHRHLVALISAVVHRQNYHPALRSPESLWAKWTVLPLYHRL